MEQKTLLKLSHISKRYKTELALKDISITLYKGLVLLYATLLMKYYLRLMLLLCIHH